MINSPRQFFDEVAASYDSAIQPFPDKFIRLIRKRFNINETSRVIDLGCGSGLLSIALARFSKNVEGVDLSEEMLQIAQSRDVTQSVRWILSSAGDLDFGRNRNDLVISFEAFHLFDNIQELIRRCTTSLKSGGFFCIGWIKYHWETKLYDVFVDEFNSVGIEWGENPNLAVFDLNSFIVKEHYLTPLTHENLRVYTTTSASKIASFLISTHKTASLSPQKRMELGKRLESRIKAELLSESSCGIDIYDVYYSQRV